jgi:death on curing protein
MRYPTYSELIFINGRLLNDAKIMSGKTRVRDIDLLLAAEQRPQASAFGQDAYGSIEAKAAALLHSIARNHPFKDGNKRTATVAALFLLRVNGLRVTWVQQRALVMILDVAEGRTDLQALAAWLQPEPTGVTLPEADTDADTQLIDDIIQEQKWLLDELATR